LKKQKTATARFKAEPGSPAWIFEGDIRGTVRTQSADILNVPPQSIQLVVTSPPDLTETSYTKWSQLFELYRAAMDRCVQALRNDGVASIIVTDRKWCGAIVSKHHRVASLFDEMGFELFLHKILVRNFGINMFRLGFSHVLCFRRKDRPRSHKAMRLQTPAEFRRDVWGPFTGASQISKTRNSFPPQVVKLLVQAFTRRDDTVLDPFCGCGTTQRVALGMRRKAIGFEINPELARLWRPIGTPT
jgi:tRNA G10  N-methylase Trm11